MSPCATQTFTGITQARFDCLVQKAQTMGITITGNVGQVTRDSITMRWSFDPATQVLELQCTSAPFFLSCGTINQTVHDTVDGCP